MWNKDWKEPMGQSANIRYFNVCLETFTTTRGKGNIIWKGGLRMGWGSMGLESGRI